MWQVWNKWFHCCYHIGIIFSDPIYALCNSTGRWPELTTPMECVEFKGWWLFTDIICLPSQLCWRKQSQSLPEKNVTTFLLKKYGKKNATPNCLNCFVVAHWGVKIKPHFAESSPPWFTDWHIKNDHVYHLYSPVPHALGAICTLRSPKIYPQTKMQQIFGGQTPEFFQTLRVILPTCKSPPCVLRMKSW